MNPISSKLLSYIQSSSPSVKANKERREKEHLEKSTLQLLSTMLINSTFCITEDDESRLKQDEFNHILGYILVALINDTRTAFIKFYSSNLEISLIEKDDAVKVLIGNNSLELAATSLEDIKDNLFVHILKRYERFDTVHLKVALEELLQNSGLYSDLAPRAASIAVFTPAFHSEKSIILGAADLILSNQGDYTPEMPKTVIIRVLYLYKNTTQTLDDAARTIFDNPESHVIAIRCAAIFVIQFQSDRSYDMFKKAAGHFLDHHEHYSKSSIISIASALIKYNESFFTAPILFPAVFTTFFKKNDHVNIIKPFSNELHETLGASKEEMVVFIKTEKKIIYKKALNAYNLWLNLTFEKAMQVNFDLAKFIIKNRNHKAIELWNANPEHSLSILESNHPKAVFPELIVSLTSS